MSRLIKSMQHGAGNRSGAIVYINGEVIEGNYHTKIIQSYLSSLKELAHKVIDQVCDQCEEIGPEKRKWYHDDFDKTGILPSSISNGFSEFDREDGEEFKLSDISLGFAHLLNHDEDGNPVKEIYLEENSLQNVDLKTVTDAIKQKYPEYTIYNDDKYNEGTGEFEKVARLKKLLIRREGILLCMK